MSLRFSEKLVNEIASGAYDSDSLNLTRGGVHPGNIQALAKALETNTHIRRVNLSGTNIGPNETRILAAALEKNPNIEELNIRGCKAGDEGVEVLGAITTLKRLDVSYNGIKFRGAQRLAEVIAHNKKLQSLDISGNPVGDRGVEPFKGNSTLVEFNARVCEITSAGALSLAQMANNGTLRKLNASCNFIYDEGIKPLEGNKTLEVLYLDQNGLSNPGMVVLASTGITILHIGSNLVSDPGAETLATKNKTLREICIAQNPVKQPGIDFLMTHPTLERIVVYYGSGGTINPRDKSTLPKSDESKDASKKETKEQFERLFKSESSPDPVTKEASLSKHYPTRSSSLPPDEPPAKKQRTDSKR